MSAPALMGDKEKELKIGAIQGRGMELKAFLCIEDDVRQDVRIYV